MNALVIIGGAKMENLVLNFKKLLYVPNRVKWGYYEALKMCPGLPEEGGIQSYERNTGIFHKHWNAFEFVKKILWVELEGMGISQNVAHLGIASSSE